jgi:hypothetical protein
MQESPLSLWSDSISRTVLSGHFITTTFLFLRKICHYSLVFTSKHRNNTQVWCVDERGVFEVIANLIV